MRKQRPADACFGSERAITRSRFSSDHSVFALCGKIALVGFAGLLVANCAQNPRSARNLTAQEQREIGSFPQGRFGSASPRVVQEGEAVPKGGGREQIGRSYTVAGRRYTPHAKPTGYQVTGLASWYGAAFHGRKTANGEVYDRHGISAAHPTMPLPSYARVTNTENRRSIIVRINDRGPFHANRVIDLSQKTAELLSFRHLGTARVRVEYLGRASLRGSDDRMLMASLTTDGTPASVPGMSMPGTMIASAPPIETPRAEPLERAPVTPRMREPVQVAMAAAPEVAPVSASIPDTPARLVRGAPVPPERPFDLATIPGAATPITVAGAGSLQPAVVRGIAPQGERQVVASLYFAPPVQPSAGFSKANPLARDLKPQRFVALSQRP